MTRKPSSIPFEELDALIRSGQVARAGTSLRQLSLKAVHRPDFVKLSALLIRTGLAKLAVRLLAPVVHPEKGKTVEPASAAEQAQYGMALVGIGVVSEALALLEKIPPCEAPESLLFRTHALFTRWDYRRAIPLLDEYLRNPLSNYDRLIAQVNLAAALVSEAEIPRAKALLSETREIALKEGANRLLGYTYEISAQLHVQLGEIPLARVSLEEAARRLSGANALDRLFIDKWSAICDFTESPKDERHALALLEIRRRALEQSHWETVRDIDRRFAILGQSQAHLVRLYFGTPFTEYRQNLLARLGRPAEFPSEYVWQPEPLTGPLVPSRMLDLSRSEGVLSGHHGLPFRLLRVLSSDFYRPFRTGTLFSELYPGEYFNPVSSPARVHQLLRRVRARLEFTESGLSVEGTRGGFRLRSAESGWGVRVSLASSLCSPFDARLRELADRFGEETFSARAAAHALGLSGRTARRLLSEAVSEHQMMSTGHQGERLYRLA